MQLWQDGLLAMLAAVGLASLLWAAVKAVLFPGGPRQRRIVAMIPAQGDGEGLEIGFNNRYLMEALRYAPADAVRIELNTGVSPAILAPTDGKDRFLYMVLPVRLKNAE